MDIILGGTHGLGGEIAHQLQSRGRETFVVGSSYDREHGNGARVDLAQRDDVEELTRYIDQMAKGVGRQALEGFYWVAGYGYSGDFADQPDVREMALVNFANVLPIAQAAWKALIARDEGHFVVVSSTSGQRARPDEAVYAATKHAQVGLARSLGLESERLGSGVRVALFMPGGMQTPFWDKERPAQYDTFLDPSKVAERIVNLTVYQDVPFQQATFERGSL